jgi:DNA-binding ferritin-like protein (Dps family)
MNITPLEIELLFGKDRAQEDENLSKYFVKTGQYEVIKSGLKELVLGRKGSGKSAIFSILTDELSKEGNTVINISPKGEDIIIVQKRIKEYSEIELDDDFKYSIAWKDYLLTEVALNILKNIKIAKEINPLYKYLVNEGKIEKTFVDKFVASILKTFSSPSVKIEELEFKFDFSGIFEKDKCEIDKVNSYMKEVITKTNYYILIDNLDEPWKNNKEMNSWLRGLILATRQVKRDFKNLKIIIFLRDDIYNEISRQSDLFDSKSEIITITWFEENNFSLRKLVATRISSFYKQLPPLKKDEIDKMWHNLYPQNVQYSTSYGTKYVDTEKYIIERTFFRPRELLQYCKLILQKSQDGNIPVTSDLIRIAEIDFCDWKVRDLVGEFAKTYSNIDQYIYTLAGKTKDWTVSYETLLPFFESACDEDKIHDDIRGTCLDLEQTIKVLYNIGFFRKQKFTDSGRRYYVTSVEETNVNPRSNSFDIHPAFRKKLISRK